MSNRLIFIVLTIVIGGFVAFSLTNGRPNTQPASPTTGTEKNYTLPNRGATGTASPNKETGRYVPYSAAVFGMSADKKRVLYFHAPWCPVCVPLDKEFQSRASEIPTGIVIYKTDYDTETDLKTRHGVTYQHTFVQVDNQGNEVAKWNGGDFDDTLARIK